MAEDKKRDVGAVAAGLIGAAIGAAVAAGSIAMADDKNRKKAEKIIGEIKKQGGKMLDLVQKETEVIRKIAQGRGEKPKKKGKKS